MKLKKKAALLTALSMMTAAFGTTVNSVAASKSTLLSVSFSSNDYQLFKKSIEDNNLFRFYSGNIVSLPDNSTGKDYLSHAAYLMYSYGIPKDDLLKIWRGSLSRFNGSKDGVDKDLLVKSRALKISRKDGKYKIKSVFP